MEPKVSDAHHLVLRVAWVLSMLCVEKEVRTYTSEVYIIPTLFIVYVLVSLLVQDRGQADWD
jgi:hypothetical protein